MKNPIKNTIKFPSFGGAGVVLLLCLLLLSLTNTLAQTSQLPPVLVSQRTLGGSGIDQAVKLIKTADKGFAILTTTDSNDGDIVGNHINIAITSDAWLAKFDSTGNKQWAKSANVEP